MSLANWFSTMFCIFICSFPDLHLFLINCNLFWLRNRLWTFSTHFYRFRSFLLVYQSFLLVSIPLPRTSRLWWFMSCSIRFYLFTQGFTSSSFSFYYNISNQKEKKTLKDLFFGYIVPKRNYNMHSEKLFRHKESCKYFILYFD